MSATLKTARKSEVSLSQQAGFSLIEALVALVILTLGYSAFAQWLNTTRMSSFKAQNYMLLEEAFDQSLNRLEMLNLLEQTSGEFNTTDVDIIWQSVIVKQSKDETYRRQPTWNVVLHSVELSFYKNQQPLHTVSVQIVKQYPDTTNSGGLFE